MSNNLEQDIKELTREELERLLLEQTEQVDYCYKKIEELHNKIDRAITYIKENDLYSEDYWEEIGHTSANDEVATKDLLEILGEKE